MRDFFHHWWALLYWNARKMAFVARGRRGRCPCQSPSDSGRAGVTHCEAAMTWDEPGRFRRVCPALRRGANGWMCGVDTAAVGPYWGRAAGWFAGAVLAAYLAGALGVWAVLVARGYRNIGPMDTLLPGRWERLTTARRDVFLRQAHAALARRDIGAMWVSLSSAAVAAPEDYEGRLALAQIHSHLLMSSLAQSGFRDLLERFPAQRARTAVAYHDVLVSTGQFEALGVLALGQLTMVDSPERGAWLQALSLALRGTGDPAGVLVNGREALAVLPPPWQSVIRAEAAVRSGDVALLEQWPSIPVTRANAALLILTGETFADRANAPAAIDAIVRAFPAIGAFERERLFHRLHARLGARKLALKSFDAMLALAKTPAERERLLAALVDFPEHERVGRLAGALGNVGSPFSQDELGSVWVAAAAAGNDAVREMAERRLQQDHAIRVPDDTPRVFSAANCALWIKVVPMNRASAAALALKFARTGSARPPARG